MMRIPRPRSRNSGRTWAGGMLLAAIATAAAAAGPSAVAAPLHSSRQAGGAGGNGGIQSTVSWSILPATSKGPDPSRILFNYGVVKPGSTVIDHVEIANRAKQAAAFSIYATDAEGTTLSNALTLLPVGKKPVDVGAWETFPGGATQLSTVIPGGKAIVVPFTIAVPQDATPGDHTGGMIAQVTIPTRSATGTIVEQYPRIAVPIEMRIPGALHAGIQVQSISTGFSDPVNPFGSGLATVSYTVTNTGNVRQTGTQIVSVSGPFGQSSSIHPAKLPTILPGDSVRVTVAVPGLYPDGPMTAHVSVTPGWPALTIALSQSAPVAKGDASLFAIPWSLIGLILLLVAIGIGIRYFLRYRGRLRRAEMSAVATRARRETERRLLGKQGGAGANGKGASGKPGSSSPAQAKPPAASAPAAQSGAPDSGSATAGSAPE